MESTESKEVDQNQIRRDALLNEYKGNLFEYLVCLFIARHYEQEGKFLTSLPETMGSILEQQESFLRNYYSYLLTELPILAQLTAVEIVEKIALPDIKKILLVGKILGASNDNRFDEADLIIKDMEDNMYPISLKLSKAGAFVNTKSGGIRTIFEKYFSHSDRLNQQKELNYFCDIEFEDFAIKMHQEAGIEYSNGFIQWENHGMEVLPGRLEGQFRVLLLEYYEKLNDKLYNQFFELYQKDKKQFIIDIFSLMGFTNQEIIQVTAFFKLSQEELKNMQVLVEDFDDVLNVKEIKFEKKSNNFELILFDRILQIRLKPMNKFTSKAFKINCSVKKIN